MCSSNTHVCHSRSCDHAALAHCEARDDREGEHGEDDAGRQDVIEVSGEGLTEVALQYGRDVNNCVSHNELKEPAKHSSHRRSEEDCARRGDVGVATLLRQMKGRVVAAHRPYAKTVSFISSIVNALGHFHLQMTDTNDISTETPGAKSVPS